MNPDREPLSPPTSPAPHGEEENDHGDASDSNFGDSYTPADGSEGKDFDSDAAPENDDEDDEDDDDGDNENNDSDVPSSPPTSVETGGKNDQRTVSGEIGASIDGYRAPAVETDDEDDENETRHVQREYFQSHYETGNDTFATHRKNWENSSQWEDEDGEPSRGPLSSPPLAHVQSQSSSRKSPSSPMFPPRPRQNANSAKSNLSHQFSSHRSPASRASSGSYDLREIHRDEKKPPLVLLHVTLLLLPGAEEVVLRHLTPTTLERGVLVEHPRGDYNLLEELILDGLGLDEDFVEESTEPEEPQEKTWEQALNISPSSPHKKAWQLRVYASNGLMTPGAWKRVWAEMERIDVEIWPRGYERKIRSNRSSSLGGHSRGTSTSSILPYPSDVGIMDEDYGLGREDGRKSLISAAVIRRSDSSNSGSLGRLASSAPVPNSPGRVRTPTPKSRKGRSRVPSASATRFNFDFNKLLTPRAVMIYAGINLFLFMHFTVFRFINLSGGWNSSIRRISFPFRSTGMDEVQVCDVADENCSVEVSGESCGSIEAADAVVEDEVEQRVLADDDERDEESVSDPEIGDENGEAPVDGAGDFDELEGEEFDQDFVTPVNGFQLDLGDVLEQEQEVPTGETESEFIESVEEAPEQEGETTEVDVEADLGETEAKEGVEAEILEVEVDEKEVEEKEVEEKSKRWFAKGFSFS